MANGYNKVSQLIDRLLNTCNNDFECFAVDRYHVYLNTIWMINGYHVYMETLKSWLVNGCG